MVKGTTLPILYYTCEYWAFTLYYELLSLVYLDNGRLHNDFWQYLKQEHNFPILRVAKLVLKKAIIGWKEVIFSLLALFLFTILDSPVSTFVSDLVPDMLGTKGTFIELKVDAKERSGIDKESLHPMIKCPIH